MKGGKNKVRKKNAMNEGAPARSASAPVPPPSVRSGQEDKNYASGARHGSSAVRNTVNLRHPVNCVISARSVSDIVKSRNDLR